MMFGASRVAESARIDKKRVVSTSREQSVSSRTDQSAVPCLK